MLSDSNFSPENIPILQPHEPPWFRACFVLKFALQRGEGRKEITLVVDVLKINNEINNKLKFLRSLKGNAASTENSQPDLSELQMNFDLEENEMKIFSEDEAMMTESAVSDLDRSPLAEEFRPMPTKVGKHLTFMYNHLN